MLIPNSAAKKRGFEYVMTPPRGEAAVVAILSDRRVQILDLPDNAQKQRTEAETISYLAEWTGKLRVPDPELRQIAAEQLVVRCQAILDQVESVFGRTDRQATRGAEASSTEWGVRNRRW